MQNIWMIIVFLSAGIIGFWCMKKIDSLFEKKSGEISARVGNRRYARRRK